MKSDFFLSIVNYNNIRFVYKNIKKSYKNRRVIYKFKLFLNCNLFSLLYKLKKGTFKFDRYNIFLIKEPKYRLIMSEYLSDKIVNQLFSRFILMPYLSRGLIDANVATREEMGSNKAYKLIESYFNKLVYKKEEIYALKIDISKYFYNIDHNLLLNKVKKKISDEYSVNFCKMILDTTNEEYVNDKIDEIVNEEKLRVGLLNISVQEKELKYKQLDTLPRYKKGKGLPIGNLSSQILAIFYMNEIDHYIKEKLRCKYYVRYMDDLVILSTDKEYLKKCFVLISKKINDELLSVNKKSNIYRCSKGVEFLGYRYFIRNNKIEIRYRKDTIKRIKKNLNSLFYMDYDRFIRSINSYKGYFEKSNTSLSKKVVSAYNFDYHIYEMYKKIYNSSVIIVDNIFFYSVHYEDVSIVNRLFNIKNIKKYSLYFIMRELNNVINYLKGISIDYIIV